MLIAADWLRRRLAVFARLTRKATRAVCRPFWRAGWSCLDIIHAMDHLPAAFGARAHTPIGRGPADHLDPAQAWWWIRTRLDAWRDPDGQPLRGYYQTRGRRKAARDAIAARYGRAATAVLDDVDLARDPVLTPEKITQFGRRVATQMRSHPAGTSHPRPTPPAAGTPPVVSDQVRTSGAQLLEATLATQASRRTAAAQRHAELMARLAPQLQAARTELAARTAPLPVPPAPAGEQDRRTAQQRYEHARALAAGYRHQRQRK